MAKLLLCSLFVFCGCGPISQRVVLPPLPDARTAPSDKVADAPSAPGATVTKKPLLDLPVGSVAVLPIRAKGQANRATLDVLDDLLLSSLQNLAGNKLRVVGKSDIDAMLGFEKAKDTLGCDEVSCAAEIAGALGVESVLSATAGTLGGKYVLTLVWIDQKTVTAFRRHSEPLGDLERTFDVGVNNAVAKLINATPSPVTHQEQEHEEQEHEEQEHVGDPAKLSSWLRGDGTWYEKDRAIYGTGGHIFFAEELGDYSFAATAEIIAGPDTVVGFLSRAGLPRAKDQGYATNIIFGERKLNVFRALNGSWYVANRAWQTWTFQEGIHSKVNRVVWESVGPRHRVTLNDKLLYEFVDGGTPRGRPGFWVESLSTVVRFSDIELRRL